MKQNSVWKWKLVLVIAVVGLSLLALYPPTDRDLIEVFRDRCENVDTNIVAILQAAQKLQQRLRAQSAAALAERGHFRREKNGARLRHKRRGSWWRKRSTWNTRPLCE